MTTNRYNFHQCVSHVYFCTACIFLCFYISGQPGTEVGRNLNPIILPEIVQAQKEQVHRVILEESSGPLEHVRLYDKYAPLVSQQAVEDVEQFLHEEHSFQEMMMEVARYQQLTDEIQYNSCKVCLNCEL